MRKCSLLFSLIFFSNPGFTQDETANNTLNPNLDLMTVKGNIKQPNIVIILADDLGYGDLSCYGATKINTPNIDKLANQGMRFTDAHTSSSVCSPSRYSLLTGRYCWRTPLKNGPLPQSAGLWFEEARITLPSMLKDEGYVTGGFGKWHLGLGEPRQELNIKAGPDWNRELTLSPNDIGFDYYYGTPGGHNMSPHVNIENHFVIGVEDGLKVRDQYRFDDAKKTDPEKLLELETYNRYDPHQLALNHTRRAVDFIKTNSGSPFFIYLPTVNVHLPHTPHEVFQGKSKVGVYGDFVQELDWVVGQIYKTLENEGLLDNTLIIFSSDNGATRDPAFAYGHFSNGQLRGQKGDIWEAGHRVPFIASWLGHIKSGTTSTQLICLTDVMPTIAAILGRSLPKTVAEDGYNILPALLGEDNAPIRETIVHHSAYGMFAIRKGPWKLCLTPGSGGLIEKERLAEAGMGVPEGQLYNLEQDLAEKKNQFEKHPEIVAELKTLLEEFKKQRYSNE